MQAAGDAAAMEQLLDLLWSATPRPTGVFVPSDSTAALLYQACAKRGIRVGADLAVVSCNYEPPTLAALVPQLTTLDVRAEAIGGCAVDLLLWRMAHPDAPPVDLTIQPVLVAGASG